MFRLPKKKYFDSGLSDLMKSNIFRKGDTIKHLKPIVRSKTNSSFTFINVSAYPIF
jgi:hypothetical protein